MVVGHWSIAFHYLFSTARIYKKNRQKSKVLGEEGPYITIMYKMALLTTNARTMT